MSLGNFSLRLEILMSSVYSLHAIRVVIFVMWLMGNQMLCSLVSLDIYFHLSQKGYSLLQYLYIVANEIFMS